MDLFHILETAVNAVVPIVLMMAFGYALRAAGFLTEEFLAVGNKLMFQFLLPFSLFETAYKIESFSVIPWDVVIYAQLTLVSLFLLGMIAVPFITRDPTRRGPILQAAFRSNSGIIGLTLAAVLGGDAAVSATAVMVAFSLPTINILAVLSLTIFMGENGQKADFKKVLKKIATNPLILGTLTGLLFMAIRVWQLRRFGAVVFSFQRDLTFLYMSVSRLGTMATPLALVVMGGQFRFTAAGDLKKEISFAVVWRCVFAPFLGLGCAIALTRIGVLSCVSTDYPGMIAQFGTPVAVSSAIMAGQMGSDRQLATQLVVWTSVASIATMFLTVCILMAMGVLVV